MFIVPVSDNDYLNFKPKHLVSTWLYLKSGLPVQTKTSSTKDTVNTICLKISLNFHQIVTGWDL